jgi:hypothetical protein
VRSSASGGGSPPGGVVRGCDVGVGVGVGWGGKEVGG